MGWGGGGVDGGMIGGVEVDGGGLGVDGGGLLCNGSGAAVYKASSRADRTGVIHTFLLLAQT